MNFRAVALHGECFAALFPFSDKLLAAPYRMRLASYIRTGEKSGGQTSDVPELLRMRVLAVRSFNNDAVLVADELVEGRDVEIAIGRQLANPHVAYLRIHYAPGGHYAARVERHWRKT